ncbi:MAG: hypothetical protein LBE62_00400 [Azonexus sp.]|nr:hypothetical protein [Azonexus sp.]
MLGMMGIAFGSTHPTLAVPDSKIFSEGNMDSNKPTALFNIDMRDASPAANCLDSLNIFPLAVERMRDGADETGTVEMFRSDIHSTFAALQFADRSGMLLVAATAQDMLYRHIAQLTMCDRYTRLYCAMVVRYFFDHLTVMGFRTFYILDNTIQEDRLAATLELFELSGIATTMPQRDGLEWLGLSNKIRTDLEATRHAIYIEPDASVNHLEAARELANEISCISTFRSRSPDDLRFEIVNFHDSFFDVGPAGSNPPY